MVEGEEGGHEEGVGQGGEHHVTAQAASHCRGSILQYGIMVKNKPIYSKNYEEKQLGKIPSLNFQILPNLQINNILEFSGFMCHNNL